MDGANLVRRELGAGVTFLYTQRLLAVQESPRKRLNS